MVGYKMKEFLPINDISNMYDIDKKNIIALYYNNSDSNKYRFKKEGNVLFVHKNFQAMFQEELQELYYKALYIAKTQTNLAREISKISKIKKTTLEKYFIRFNFKQTKKAIEIMGYIKKYIEGNSLFSIFDLNQWDNI